MWTFIKHHYYEIIGGIFCLVLGTLSGYGAQAGDHSWYASLIKPTFNPPNWIFAPVWSALYIAMGIALGKIWRNRTKNTLIPIPVLKHCVVARCSPRKTRFRSSLLALFHSGNGTILMVFAGQFILNLLWSPLFFYYQSIDWALYDICLLWPSIAFLMFLARKQRTIFLLLLPYFLWVSFALVLTYKLYELNLG